METTTIMIILLIVTVVSSLTFLFRRYLKYRTMGFEDRFMALYGKEDWDASNMELVLAFPSDRDAHIKETFKSRLRDYLKTKLPAESLFHEKPVFGAKLSFTHNEELTAEDLEKPRCGIWFDYSKVGQIRVVWSHIQADGLRVWRELRPLFDENPAILPFDNMKTPPPLAPELLSLPTTLRAMTFTSNLVPEPKSVNKDFRIWSTKPIKALKDKVKGSFNLVSTSMLLDELFHRHPEVDKLTVGLTVAFPFLQAKNTYGVYSLEVKRGNFEQIYKQVIKQVRHPLFIWGNFSNQSLALSALPDEMFMKTVSYFRGKIDVLISNLPVGKADIELGDSPIQIACHTDQLTIPYYFLLLGTKSNIHLSCTSKFDHEHVPSFLDQDRVISRIDFGGQKLPDLEPAIQNALSTTNKVD